ISVALSREYLERFGAVLHHNIDKGLLVAGKVEKGFGRGRVIKPMEFIIGDRATFRVGKVRVPVARIAEDSARGWFRENLPNIDPVKDVKVRVVLQPGSAELSDIFSRKGRARAANDTSAAVGYAPLTQTEKAVYQTERFINSPAFKLRFPETGEDVKVMGIRRGTELDVTIACPLLSAHVKDEPDYFRRKKAVASAIKDFLSGFPFTKATVNYNSLDVRGRGVGGAYLSLLGTSAEDADSGQVGRGNRVNGVISLNRPMGTEAAAGKNPVSHVGKIYSVLSHQMAAELYERIPGLKEVYVWLLSQIGEPVDRPKEVYVRVLPGRKRIDEKAVRKGVSLILAELLSGIGALTGELSRGEHPVC
ncbi:MAG: methionine adenosyltransferase, partial [Deltaproteobacteria bacterium]|nr:methionine adenosyltransferase [Deltaproteobacteria bacterium]